jgi:transcription elongation factor GreA
VLDPRGSWRKTPSLPRGPRACAKSSFTSRASSGQAIAVAREHGDLKENAEYHAARDKQSFIEGRIKDLESKLALAEVIDPKKLAGDRVAFGAIVKLSNVDSGEEVTYQILGADEADLAKGSISVTSPIARQLIGKQVGDEVKMRMPGGERTYEVLDISFG